MNLIIPGLMIEYFRSAALVTMTGKVQTKTLTVVRSRRRNRNLLCLFLWIESLEKSETSESAIWLIGFFPSPMDAGVRV
ncbi:MAG: hypothetical protein EXS25_04285 [Pedosphaera sp.]|nr:hypothetical protein [Pedosphaera sp.]